MRWLMLTALGSILTTLCLAEEVDPLHDKFLAGVQAKLPVNASPVCRSDRLSDFRLLGRVSAADEILGRDSTGNCLVEATKQGKLMGTAGDGR